MKPRRARAARHRLRRFFAPRSVAVVGASDDLGKIRGRILAAVRECGFAGAIYPVTRSHREIGGLSCYASLESLPEVPDLAIIVVPAEVVADLLRDCAEKGIRAALIMSSGFGEQGDEQGRSREAAIAELARAHDMLVCGPNAEGFYNAALPLAATFSPVVQGGVRALRTVERAGRVAIVSQSGGIGFAIYDRGMPKGINVSHVVSMGNEAAMDSLEVLDYLLDEDDTRVVAMFVEGFRTPRDFAPVAEKAARLDKPLLVAKMGRSEAAARAAISHTATLAGSYRSYEAVLRHHGVTLVEDAEQMVDLANLFSRYAGQWPRGKRVGVLTSSGGAGIWLTDTCAANGLEVAELDGETRAALAELMPAYGNTRNPVDITAQGVYGFGYARPLEILARSPAVDVVLVTCSMIRPETIARDAQSLRLLADRIAKPVMFCGYTGLHPEAVAHLAAAGFACTNSMPNACRAMAALADYGAFKLRYERRVGPPPQTTGAAEPASLERGAVLCEHRARRVLEAAGLDVGPASLATGAEGAVEAFRRIGGPVALKLQSPALVHKTEVGGVLLNVSGEARVREGFETIVAAAARADPRAPVEGVLVQPMAPPGVEVVVGVSPDPDFGLLLMVGLGGVLVEALQDVAFAPVPLAEADAEALLERLRGRRVLAGVRGRPPADVAALIALIVRLAAFAARNERIIAEIDLNPVIVHARGAGLTVADALIVTR